eukprot:scaffold231248_cov23-Tisochrysis_lutea.AAC.1
MQERLQLSNFTPLRLGQPNLMVLYPACGLCFCSSFLHLLCGPRWSVPPCMAFMHAVSQASTCYYLHAYGMSNGLCCQCSQAFTLGIAPQICKLFRIYQAYAGWEIETMWGTCGECGEHDGVMILTVSLVCACNSRLDYCVPAK